MNNSHSSQTKPRCAERTLCYYECVDCILSSRKAADEFWKGVVASRMSPLKAPNLFPPLHVESEELSQVHAEYDAMRAELLKIAHWRNALTPTCRLLPELLVVIFRFCQINEPLQPNYATSCISWIKVTHVCRIWRAVALAHPELWVRVNMGMSSTGVAEMIHRSKKVELCFDDQGAVPMPWPEFVEQALFRTRSIDWHPTSSNEILQVLTLPMPRMESLCIDYSWGHGGQPPSTPPRLDAPRLRHLHLRHCGRHVAWTSSSCLHNLVSLELTTAWWNDNNKSLPPTFTEVLYALKKMLLLECLVLERCLPHSPPNHSHPIIELPNLSRCTLTDNWLDVVNVLTPLRTQCDVELTLYVYMDSNTLPGRSDYTPLINCLHTYFNGQAQSHLLELDLLDMGKSSYLRVLASPQRELDDNRRAGAQIDFIWSTPEDDVLDHPGRASFVRLLAQSLPIAHVTIIGVELAVEADVWCYILRRAVCLEEIRASGRAGISLCQVLADIDVSPGILGGVTPHSHCGEKLKKLTIFSVQFLAAPDVAENKEKDAAECLRVWTARRKECGHPIASLELIQCIGVEEHLEGWKASLADGLTVFNSTDGDGTQ
ncbi:hypothetical protein FA95DRAFT_1035806 [Auriscalpium vulgare]|uniref:Uncharacterized protein n=1 Tax=Auriscalpium vulgare TaxID=40419 RepID=A0ACB8R5P8_9AGAM|nr:hypothetical protein FA95DRAFT_1035806 [Auriscalpium vulgare]